MKHKLIATLLLVPLCLSLAACGTPVGNDTESISGGTGSLPATEMAASEVAMGEDSEASAESETPDDATEAITDGTEGTEAEEVQETTDPDVIPSVDDITVASEEDGVLLLKALFGTEDAETGYPYIFIYLNTVTVDDADYYAYTWSWNVDNDHYSRLTDVFVATDGSSVYQGDYDPEGCVFNSEDELS